MNIVFLDFDGVLNNVASAAMGVHLVPEKIILVRRLCEETDAEIVVSSTWKKLYNRATLQHFLWRTGLGEIDIIDVTPDTGRTRGDEIKAWLDNHPKTENYVILDDDNDMLQEQLPHFIRVPNDTGLTWREFDQAIKILRGKLEE